MTPPRKTPGPGKGWRRSGDQAKTQQQAGKQRISPVRKTGKEGQNNRDESGIRVAKWHK